MNFWNPLRAKKIADREEIDAFIASSAENVAYATGFWSPGGFFGTEPSFALMPVEYPDVRELIIYMGPLDMITDLNLDNVNINTFGHFYWHKEPDVELKPQDQTLFERASNPRPNVDLIDALIETINKYQLEKSNLALDETGITVKDFQRLQESLPGATLKLASLLFREMRTIKTPEEIKRIREVFQITEEALRLSLEAAEEGITEKEIWHIVSTHMVQNDAVPVLGAVGFGDKGAHPNSIPTDRKLCKGDLIRYDIGARRLLYYSDFARVACLGDPSPKAKNYYEALKSGQQAALDIVKPGESVSNLFNVAVETVRSNGMPHYKRPYVGHGIGAVFYEHPIIKPESTAILEEGMVINIETPYYELGFGGFNVEDPIVVTKTGFEFLSSGERPLYVI